MTPTDAAALITAIGGVLWPLVGLALLWTLRKRFAAMVDSIVQRGGGVKLAGFEVTVAQATEQQQVLIADLQLKLAGLEDRLDAVPGALTESAMGPNQTVTDPSSTPRAIAPIPGEAADVDLASIAASRTMSDGTCILWVDGHPEAAAALIDSIEKRGARVTSASSISDALEQLADREFSAIVARMSIGEKSDGGVDLARRVLRLYPLATIYILTGARGAERHGRDALVAGAHFVTDSPAELIRQLTRLGN